MFLWARSQGTACSDLCLGYRGCSGNHQPGLGFHSEGGLGRSASPPAPGAVGSIQFFATAKLRASGIFCWLLSREDPQLLGISHRSCHVRFPNVAASEGETPAGWAIQVMQQIMQSPTLTTSVHHLCRLLLIESKFQVLGFCLGQ